MEEQIARFKASIRKEDKSMLLFHYHFCIPADFDIMRDLPRSAIETAAPTLPATVDSESTRHNERARKLLEHLSVMDELNGITLKVFDDATLHAPSRSSWSLFDTFDSHHQRQQRQQSNTVFYSYDRQSNSIAVTINDRVSDRSIMMQLIRALTEQEMSNSAIHYGKQGYDWWHARVMCHVASTVLPQRFHRRLPVAITIDALLQMRPVLATLTSLSSVSQVFEDLCTSVQIAAMEDEKFVEHYILPELLELSLLPRSFDAQCLKMRDEYVYGIVRALGRWHDRNQSGAPAKLSP